MISSFRSTILVTVTPFLGALVFGLIRPYKNDLYNRLDCLYWSLFQMTQIMTLYNFYYFRIPLFVPLTILFLPITLLGISKMSSVCCPTLLEKFKKRLIPHIFSSIVADGRGTTSQLTVYSNGLVESECSDQDLPDRLVNPENYSSVDFIMQ